MGKKTTTPKLPPNALGAISENPEALDDHFRSLSWMDLTLLSATIEVLVQAMQRVTEERAPNIHLVDSLSIDELKAHIKAKSSEWEYAKKVLEEKGEGG